jgi:homoserine dehydrogenase
VSRPPRPIRVALLGLGTVGREVARGLVERAAELRSRAGGRAVELVAVGVRDPGRRREVQLPAHVRVTDDLRSLAEDPAVDAVVELIGGQRPAADIVATALRRGAAVVTANKALLAREGPRLEAVTRECGGMLRFEAAVGGGIPVLGPLASDLSANAISSISGIVNGTTNYILGQILERGQAYEVVLAEAQALGYAEADPSADVEGDDAADKLVLLVRLAFGGWLDRESIVRRLPTVRGTSAPGILSIHPGELEAAAVLDSRLKLLATARRGAGGSAVEASVVPTVVSADSALGTTDGARNRIEVQADLVGMVGFDGPGAGGAPTSSAVLADVLAVARGAGSTWGDLPPPVPVSVAGAGLAAARLDRPRSWFAYLPGVSPGDVPTAIAASAVEGPRGTALLSRPIAVRDLQEALGDVLAEGADAGLYPLQEAA